MLMQRFSDDNAATAYWSLVEIDIGIVCVSLPTVRPLLRRLVPRCFGSTADISRTTLRQSGVHVRSEITRTDQSEEGNESDIVHLVDLKNPWARHTVTAECKHT